MKTRIALLIVLCGLLIGAVVIRPPSPVQTFYLAEGSEVSFKTFGKDQPRPSRGKFTSVSSKVTLDLRELSSARGEFEVLLTSVATEDPSWDLMFRDAPFLELAQFPQAKYQLTRVGSAAALAKDTPTKAVLVGNLTFHGQTRRVPAFVTISRTRILDKQGESSTLYPKHSTERIVLEGKLRIRWTDFNIQVPPGAPANLAGEGAIVSIKLIYVNGKDS